MYIIVNLISLEEGRGYNYIWNYSCKSINRNRNKLAVL